MPIPSCCLEDRVVEQVLPTLVEGILGGLGEHLETRPALNEQRCRETMGAAITVLYRLLLLQDSGSLALRHLAEEVAEVAGAAGPRTDERIARAYRDDAYGLSDRIGGTLSTLPGRIPDRYLALAIDRLVRGRDRAQSEQRWIQTRSLDVRQLGSIYERLLGIQLRMVECGDGRSAISLVSDRRSRKATGSYYTPEVIVQHILEQAVGPALDRKFRSLRSLFQASGAGGVDDLLARLFDFRVLDPAMGCGYFLVKAVDFIAERMQAFLCELASDGRSGRSDLLSDIGRMRVEVLSRCIYGVDIDPMAVEIAKLGLGLHGGGAVAVESSLDDHLRCGNSLVGAWIRKAEEVTCRLPGQSGTELPARRMLLHLLTARHFGCLEAAEAVERRLGAANPHPDQLVESLEPALLREVRIIAEDPRNRFFHWEIEFPEVFSRRENSGCMLAGAGRAGSGHSPGFDAVIGNPPYLSFSGRQGGTLRFREYFEQHYDCRGWLTLHGLFVQRAAQLSRDAIGLIVPDQVGHLAGYSWTREAVLKSHRVGEVRYWGEDVFDGVITPSLTVVAFREQAGQTEIHGLDGSVHKTVLFGGAPWIGRRVEDRLIEKLLHGGGSLGSLVADPGVHTGNCSGKLILPASELRRDTAAILEGKQVWRYRCDRPTRVLRLDYTAGSEEYFTIRPLDRYRAAGYVVRQTAAFPIVGPRQHADYFRNSLLALYNPGNGCDVRYLVGILNSRLLRYVYQAMVAESGQKTFPQVKVGSLRSLPIRWPDLDCKADRDAHDRLVGTVERMLRLEEEPGPGGAESIATDRRIDEMVYAIYGLTPSERLAVDEACGELG